MINKKEINKLYEWYKKSYRFNEALKVGKLSEDFKDFKQKLVEMKNATRKELRYLNKLWNK